MCYDVKTLTRRAQEYAKRYGSKAAWEKHQQKNFPVHHTSGFAEPVLPVVTAAGGDSVQSMIWHPACYQPGYNTLNARDDRLSTSRYWKEDFRERRCLVMIDGFYDFHEHSGKKFPYYVSLSSGEPFMIGGLYRTVNLSGEQRTTVTLVTTRANKEMAWLHNEPAYSPDSRMMLVVPGTADQQWLAGSTDEAEQVIKPLPDNTLVYHPVKKLRGKSYPGNVPAVSDPYHYPELTYSQGSLF